VKAGKLFRLFEVDQLSCLPADLPEGRVI